MCDDIQKIQSKLKTKLTEKRYIHTLGVQYTSAALAMRYRISIFDASMAGLLHDCAKNYSNEELIKRCQKNGIDITDVELRNGFLLHAKLGSYYAKSKYGVDNEEILSAIRWHTTGKPGMSTLEAIVFTADYIEPSRKPLPNLDDIRNMAYIDLDEAVYMILDSTLNYLGSEAKTDNKGREIDNNTVEAYIYYKKIHNSKFSL